MAEKQARAEAHRQPTGAHTPASKGKPINVMAKQGTSVQSDAIGCSDLRRPDLPYWHPLNGPFPSD